MFLCIFSCKSFKQKNNPSKLGNNLFLPVSKGILMSCVVYFSSFFFFSNIQEISNGYYVPLSSGVFLV